eukprot:142529_1
MTEPPPAYTATNQQEAPPPYAGKTEATQETKPPKVKTPDAPAPDGEGPLGPPLKRIMYIGAPLLLYCILSFWMPVYWMRGAASPCLFACSQYYTPSSISIGSSSVSIGASSYGCYETTDATCQDTCEANCEICEDSGDVCTDMLDTAYEGLYLNSGITVRLVSFTLTTVGIALVFLGLILGYFAVKKGSQMYSRITTGLLGVGGLLVIVGAIIFLATWHENIDFEEILAAWQILVLIEWLLPAIMVIILAVDVRDPSIFNDERKRMMAMTMPFAVCGITAGILMAYIVNWEPEISVGYDFPMASQCGCIAAGYFIVGLMCTARILIVGEYVKVSDNPASVISAKFGVSVLLGIGGFILAVGYWAWMAKLFDCDYNVLSGSVICESIPALMWINGDTVYAFVAISGDVDPPYENQFKAYYVAYSFFVLAISAVIAFDMDIVSNYKAVRTAQKVASAAS